VPCKKHKST